MEARLSFKDLICVLFLKRSEQRNGWDLGGAVWSGGCQTRDVLAGVSSINKNTGRSKRQQTRCQGPRGPDTICSQIHRGGQVTCTALRKEMTEFSSTFSEIKETETEFLNATYNQHTIANLKMYHIFKDYFLFF